MSKQGRSRYNLKNTVATFVRSAISLVSPPGRPVSVRADNISYGNSDNYTKADIASDLSLLMKLMRGVGVSQVNSTDMDPQSAARRVSDLATVLGLESDYIGLHARDFLDKRLPTYGPSHYFEDLQLLGAQGKALQHELDSTRRDLDRLKKLEKGYKEEINSLRAVIGLGEQEEQ